MTPAAIAQTLTTTRAVAAPRLGMAVADLWRTLRKDLLEPYRPERHYMRGPGPKWREKHAA